MMSRRLKIKDECSVGNSLNTRVLRQMSIGDAFRKSKLSRYKFGKPVLVTPVTIEIDSDSETELTPFELNCDKTESDTSGEGVSGIEPPSNAIRSALDTFDLITSTPKTQRNSEATLNISWSESASAAILPSYTVTTDSAERNASDGSDRTLLYAIDSFPQAPVPDESRSEHCSNTAAKQRLNFDKIGSVIEKHTELSCSRKCPENDHVISNNSPKRCEEGEQKRKASIKTPVKSGWRSKKRTVLADQQIRVAEKTPSKANNESTGDLPQSCSLSFSMNVDSANPKNFNEKSGCSSVDPSQCTSKSGRGPVNGHKSCTSTKLSPVIARANENTKINEVVVNNEECSHPNTSGTSNNNTVSQPSVATSELLVQNGQNSISTSQSAPVSKDNCTTKILETLNSTNNSAAKEFGASPAAANKIISDMSSGKRALIVKKLDYGRNHGCNVTLNIKSHKNPASVVLPNATQLKLDSNSPTCTTKNLSSGLEIQNGGNSNRPNDGQMPSTSKQSKSVSGKPSPSTTDQQVNVNERASCSRLPIAPPFLKQNTKLMQKTPNAKSSSPTKADKCGVQIGSPCSPSKGSPKKTREIKSLKAKEGQQLQIKQLDELVGLLKMVVSNRYLKSLLSPQEFTILKNFMKMEDNNRYIIMKLYIWKRSWYNIFKFCSKAKIEIDGKGVIECFNFLKKENFVDSDYRGETDMIDLLQEMDVSHIKQVMEELRIRPIQGTKEELIKRIVWATTSQTTLGRKTLKDMVMDVIEKKLGFAIKIRDEVCEAFFHSYLLATFTNPNFEDIQTYFRDIIHNRVVFPSAPIEDCIVFYSREKFKRFAEALKVEKELEELLTHRDNNFRIYSLGTKTYQSLIDCPKDRVDHKNMPHLTRFTAEHVYSRVLSKCCEKVFTKERGYPEDVKKWLEYLVERFPESRRLWKWYHKLIWLHMRHLPEINCKMAAKILIDVFETKSHLLGESGELELGSLGVRLKNSTRHRLDQIYHDRISALIPRMIDDTAFPHAQIDSQCIRSEVSGRKRIYTSKSDGEMTAKYVEQVALDYYAENGYPGGEHCEGSLIRALCMLYFWDIIYHPEKSVPGTFISKLQTAPLDMFSPYFYKNRRDLIDARITEISYKWSQEELIRFGKNNWQKHSHELSAFGTLMNVIKDVDTVDVLVITIGREVLAKIFQRLIKNIGEFSSGMPDLLVWNVDLKTHKFIEVKGEGDKLSHKQTLWLKYLQKIGANIEVCIVHSTGSKRKKIKKVSNENTEARASTSRISEENEVDDDHDSDAD